MKRLIQIAVCAAVAAFAIGCSVKYVEAQLKAEELRTIGIDRANASSSATAVANENAATLNNAADCSGDDCNYKK